MKKKLFTLLTLLLCLCCGAWATDATFTGNNLNIVTSGKTQGSITLSDASSSGKAPTFSDGVISLKNSGGAITITAVDAKISKVVIAQKSNNARFTAPTGGTLGSRTKIGSTSYYEQPITYATARQSTTISVTGGTIDVNSIVVTYTDNAVKAPNITPNSGDFLTTQTFTLSTTTDGADIYYTIDGEEPTSGSNHYTAPFTISTLNTLLNIKAIAIKGDDKSFITTSDNIYVSTALAKSTWDLTSITADDLSTTWWNGTSNRNAITANTDEMMLNNHGADLCNGIRVGRPQNMSAGKIVLIAGKGIRNNNDDGYFKFPAVIGKQYKITYTTTASSKNVGFSVSDTEADIVVKDGESLTTTLATTSDWGYVTLEAKATTIKLTNGGSNKANTILSSIEELAPATKFDVTYHANGSGEADVEHNVSAVEANMFTWAGHSFTGWNTAADGSGDPYAVGASVTGDLELYAQWKVNTPEISCTNNVVTISVPTGSTVYYTDDGTTTPTSESTPYTEPFAITATKTIKAIAIQANCTNSEVATQECEFATPKYTVTYELNGGEGNTPTQASTEEGGKFNLAAAPSRTCYTFNGWKCNVDNVTYAANYEYTMTAAPTTFTAQWTPVYASGNYVFDGNQTLGTSPNQVTCGTGTTSDFRIDNIFFKGGTYDYEDNSGAAGGDGDNFKGWKWKSANGTIKFIVENDQVVTIGIGSIKSPAAATVDYTNLSGAATNATLEAGQNNIYTVKAGTMVTITHNNSSGNTVTLKKILINNISTPADPTEEGETVTLTTSNNMAGWRAFNPDGQGYTLDANTTAYIVTSAPTDNKVTLVTLAEANGDIPGNTPVILKTTSSVDSYKMTLTKKAGVADYAGDANKLKVTTASQDLSAGVCRLGYGTTGIGFYAYSTASAAAGIIYLDATPAAAAGKGYTLVFESEATGINAIDNGELAIDNDAPMYNLAGQKVTKSYKGVVIQNGKKYINK